MLICMNIYRNDILANNCPLTYHFRNSGNNIKQQLSQLYPYGHCNFTDHEESNCGHYHRALVTTSVVRCTFTLFFIHVSDNLLFQNSCIYVVYEVSWSNEYPVKSNRTLWLQRIFSLFVFIKINASEAVRIISVVYNAEKEKGLLARTKGDHWRKEAGALQMT